MKRKGQMTLGVIVMVFIAVIVVLSLIQPIANTQAQMTTKQVKTDEAFNLTALSCYVGGTVNTTNSNCNLTVTNAPSGWKTTGCPLESVVVTNNTGTALVLNTDYSVVASTGVVQMLNTSDTNSSNLGERVLVDYTYCADGYNQDTGSRSIIALVTLFSGLALVAFLFVGIKKWL